MTSGTALAELERAKLPNGLRVVVAPDRSSTLVAVAVAYDVGFRSEPEGRTGFAHLFEHLMFQGSEHIGKIEHMRLVESAGGVINGHTRADITAYYEALPAGGLELALWLEADRMGALAVNEENLQNQISVVKEEIKVNVLNQPYGGFPWITLPALAYETYPNAHNGYGDFADLEGASVEDAAGFYRRFYAPSNAVLVVAGDCDPSAAVELTHRYFGGIAARPAPVRTSFSEARPTEVRRRVLDDPLIPQPAFAAGYRVPDPVSNLGDLLSYSVLGSILADGDASRLRSRLVHRDRTVTDLGCLMGVFGGEELAMRDPMLWQVVMFHPGAESTDALLGSLDEELEELASSGPDPDELARVAASAASGHWRGIDPILERALALADAELIHGRAELVGQIPDIVAGIGSDAVASAAADLLGQHRAILELRPGAS